MTDTKPQQRKFRRIWLVALLMLAATFRGAAAGEPTEAIRSAIDRGVEVIKGANLRDRKQRTDAIERLRPVVYPLFDFKEMAMRSLGSHWRSIDGQQQSEFIAVFTKLLERTYADQIDLYNGQQVAYRGERVDGDYVEVDTQLIAADKQRYSVVYRLHKVDGKWLIYDVVAEGISIVSNYRAQFARTLNKTSFPLLLEQMKQKIS